jgi:metal-responsive CopG/Arc/MetJ family transcriptional regulator
MNTNRTTKIVGFSVPPTVVREVESLARQERRTKSELFREMVRVYRRYRLQRDRDEERWIQTLIDETKAEEARKPTSQADLVKESERLTRYGAQQGKKLRIKPKDVNRLVHAVRSQQ